MRVTVDIPNFLQRYLEYIPKEDLPDILVAALKSKIFGEIKQVEQDKRVGLEALMSLIEEGKLMPANSNKSIHVVETAATKTEENIAVSIPEEVRQLKVKTVEAASGQDDDLDDFMDLMK